jgi:hypothetical protein
MTTYLSALQGRKGNNFTSDCSTLIDAQHNDFNLYMFSNSFVRSSSKKLDMSSYARNELPGVSFSSIKSNLESSTSLKTAQERNSEVKDSMTSGFLPDCPANPLPTSQPIGHEICSNSRPLVDQMIFNHQPKFPNIKALDQARELSHSRHLQRITHFAPTLMSSPPCIRKPSKIVPASLVNPEIRLNSIVSEGTTSSPISILRSSEDVRLFNDADSLPEQPHSVRTDEPHGWPSLNSASSSEHAHSLHRNFKRRRVSGPSCIAAEISPPYTSRPITRRKKSTHARDSQPNYRANFKVVRNLTTIDFIDDGSWVGEYRHILYIIPDALSKTSSSTPALLPSSPSRTSLTPQVEGLPFSHGHRVAHSALAPGMVGNTRSYDRSILAPSYYATQLENNLRHRLSTVDFGWLPGVALRKVVDGSTASRLSKSCVRQILDREPCLEGGRKL